METDGKIQVTIGKYTCRANIKIVGLTDTAIEDFNKLIAKEEQDERDSKKTA